MNAVIEKKTNVFNLGLKGYEEVLDFQTKLFNEILEVKSWNRTNQNGNPRPTKNYLIVCQHPHIFTIGKSGNKNNLLIRPEKLESIQSKFLVTNRGGDITYHGPGQIVLYPVIDLENFMTDIHRYLRLLEEAVIQTLKTFSINGYRISGLTGVWVDLEKIPHKICALGVKTSRWVAMHGLALNVNTDISYFDYIVPCGIADKAITSMNKILNSKQDIKIVQEVLIETMGRLFNMELITQPLQSKL